MKYSIAHIYIPVPAVSARLDVWNYRAGPPAFGALVCLLMIHLVNIAERPKINHFQCVVIEIMKFLKMRVFKITVSIEWQSNHTL